MTAGGLAGGWLRRDGLLSPALLAALRVAFRDDPGVPAEVRPPDHQTFTVQEDVRRVWEVTLPDDLHDTLVAMIEAERPAIENTFGLALEPCDAVAALSYPTGAFYRTHRDAGGETADQEIDRRVVSVVVFVNSGELAPDAEFGGGVLRLYPDDEAAPPTAVHPVAGTLVAFPSSWLHDVTPVTHGHRYAVVTWLLAARAAGSR
jgi:SM-20-related protein